MTCTAIVRFDIDIGKLKTWFLSPQRYARKNTLKFINRVCLSHHLNWSEINHKKLWDSLHFSTFLSYFFYNLIVSFAENVKKWSIIIWPRIVCGSCRKSSVIKQKFSERVAHLPIFLFRNVQFSLIRVRSL